MVNLRFALGVFVVGALLIPGYDLARPVASQPAEASPVSAGPVLFVENAGQWPDEVRFQVWGSPFCAGAIWLADDAIWVTILEDQVPQVDVRSPFWPQDLIHQFDQAAGTHDPRLLPSELRGTSLKLTFPGSNPHVRIEPIQHLATTLSYFIGNNPARWRPDVPAYDGVRYVDLYPGIDLVLGGPVATWRLEAAPGAAVDQVRLRVDGAGVVALEQGMMRLESNGKPFLIDLPMASFDYQAVGVSRHGESLALPVRTRLQPSQLTRAANTSPSLIYGTFLGGCGTDAIAAVATDETGSAYVTGDTFSRDFFTTYGAFSATYNGGGYDGFVAKFSPDGGGLAYATFLGGSGSDYGAAIAVDASGSAYVTGMTFSDDFPVTSGAFDTSHDGNTDAFVVKLDPAGRMLAYGTFLGGAEYENGDSIALDEPGNAYVAGRTNSNDFPTTPDGFDTSNDHGDAFVVKLNLAGSELAYGTFLGGSGWDGAYSVRTDTMGRAYVTGFTHSADFPVTPSAFDTSFNGSYDGFVVSLNPTGSQLIYATFLGGSGEDRGYAITVDEAGNAYVTGTTESSDFPATPGAFDVSYDPGAFGQQDAFVAKLNADGDRLAYATFLGGSKYDSGMGITVDGTGSAYVAGSTSSGDFPTTPGAFDTSHNSGAHCRDSCVDAFVVQLNPVGSRLLMGTYLGGSEDDYGGGIALDTAGKAVVVGITHAVDFPTTPSAWDPSYNGGTYVGGEYRDGDGFVAKLSMDAVFHRWLPTISRR